MYPEKNLRKSYRPDNDIDGAFDYIKDIYDIFGYIQ